MLVYAGSEITQTIKKNNMFEPHYIYSPFYRSQGFYRPENFVLKTTEDFSGFNANFAQIPPKSPFYSGQRLAADIRP